MGNLSPSHTDNVASFTAETVSCLLVVHVCVINTFDLERLTPPSAALAQLTKTIANHQAVSRPRHRASVGWTEC